MEIPSFIRKLVSTDPEIQMNGYLQLYGMLYHQGHVYEASLYSLPFLVELLSSPEVLNKQGIAVLVAEIGTGSLPLTAVVNDGNDWSGILRKQGKSLEAELQKERDIAAKIKVEVSKSLPQLAQFVSDPDPTVRRIIVDVLSVYPEEGRKYLGLLKDALEIEQDLNVREEIQKGVNRILS